MFKHYKWLIALVTVGIFGFTTQTVDASASFGGEGQSNDQAPQYEKQENNRYQHTNRHYYNVDLEKYFERYFSKWNVKWNQEPTEKVEQPAKPEVNQPAPAPQPTPEQPKEESQPEQQAGDLNQFEQQVVELTNQERAKQGLPALKIDYELSKVAREKSRDIQANNYFAHNSPTYGSPFDMMEAFGIDYRSAGENIAKGQRSPSEVVNAWMNSEGHRANILSNKYTHIGVGYVEQGNVWTQHFIGK